LLEHPAPTRWRGPCDDLEAILTSIHLVAIWGGGCVGGDSGLSTDATDDLEGPRVVHLGAEESVLGAGGHSRTGIALEFLDDGSMASGRLGSYSASFDAYDHADDAVGAVIRGNFDAGELTDRLIFNDRWGDPVLLQQPDTNGFGRSILACGDVTGNGVADIAVAETLSDGSVGRWAVFVDGEADGTTLLSEILGPSVGCGDQNHDDVADFCTSRGVAFGPLTVGHSVAKSWTPTMSHVASVDLDQDGSSDLVLAGSSRAAVYGLGDLEHQNDLVDLSVEADLMWSAQGDAVTALSTGDLDNDGVDDLVVAVTGAAPRILIASTAVGGDLDALAVASIERADVETLRVGDLDADGWLDLVAAGAGEVVVWRGPIVGSQTVDDAAVVFRGMQYPSDGLGTAVATSDTDGDGVWELALGAPFFNSPEDNLDSAEGGRVWWLRAPLSQ
jgi:hypothetical protein